MRKVTNLILEMINEGTLDKEQLIRDLLRWMPEAEVEHFAEASGLLDTEEEEADSDTGAMDGDHDSAMASTGWGTDEDYGYFEEDRSF